MPSDKPVQRPLISAIQEVPCDILDVLLTFLTEQKTSEIGKEMFPLRFVKQGLYTSSVLPNISTSFVKNIASHPQKDGNDVLLCVFYGGFRKCAKALL